MIEPLPDSTTIGTVSLTVSNLERSLTFYREILGCQVQERENESAILGADDTPLIHLQSNPGARRPAGPTTGLYHFAILLPARVDLARALHHLAQSGARLQGFADHFVSEAIYLADPDGNGIEIYRDRPRSEWPYRGEQIQIGTVALDLDDLLAELDEPVPAWAGLPSGTTIGHVHLQVSNLQAAEQFYREVIGFDLMMHYGSAAAFLSAGGYHHHLGLNTWAGAGAPPPPPDAVGLDWYEIRLPPAALDAVLARARSAGLSPKEDGEDRWLLPDPAQNLIRLVPLAFP